MKSQPKHSSCKKKLQPRPEKGCDENDVKSKGGGNAADHIKNFDNDDPDHNVSWPQFFLQLGCFWLGLVSYTCILNDHGSLIK